MLLFCNLNLEIREQVSYGSARFSWIRFLKPPLGCRAHPLRLSGHLQSNCNISTTFSCCRQCSEVWTLMCLHGWNHFVVGLLQIVIKLLFIVTIITSSEMISSKICNCWITPRPKYVFGWEVLIIYKIDAPDGIKCTGIPWFLPFRYPQFLIQHTK